MTDIFNRNPYEGETTLNAILGQKPVNHQADTIIKSGTLSTYQDNSAGRKQLLREPGFKRIR